MQAFTHSIFRLVPASPRIPITIDTRYRYHARAGPFEHWPYGAPLHGYDLYAPQYRISYVRNHKISLITIVVGASILGVREEEDWKDIITRRTLITLLYTVSRDRRLKVSIHTIDRRRNR